MPTEQPRAGAGLNKAQQQAAQHTDGPMLVFAGPGSGKTTVILHRVRHLIESRGADPHEILVATFTKAAAGEMRARYAAMTTNREGVTFCTLHAFFFRVLRTANLCAADSVADTATRHALLRECLQAHNDSPQAHGQHLHLDDETIERLASSISREKNRHPSDDETASRQSGGLDKNSLRALRQAYDNRLRERGLIDFDSMQADCHALFCRNEQALAHWRARYRYILVDEFQDVNRTQYECLRMLAAPRNNLFAVGDDDQSIYGFRGSQPAFLLGFAQDYPEAVTIKLETNYRSNAAIVALSNAVIQSNLTRSQKNMQSAYAAHNTDASPIIARPLNPQAEAQWIAEKIISLQSACPHEEIAVIFRMHIQAQAIMDALARRHIPFTAREAMPNLYAHSIAKDIAAYFRLALNRRDDEALARIIHRPVRYIYKEALHQAIASQSPGGALAALYASPLLTRRHCTALDTLTLHLNVIAKQSACKAIRYLRETVGYDDNLRDYATRRHLNLRTLRETLDALQESARGFASLSDWLTHAEDSITTAKNTVTTHLSDTPANNTAPPHNVTLTTMHGAKGLEFDTVFVAGVVEGIVPHTDCMRADLAEEERRLLYVALTRAKQRLYISVYREHMQTPAAPSRFITPFMADA